MRAGENSQSQPWNAERRSASGLGPGETGAIETVDRHIDESRNDESTLACRRQTYRRDQAFLDRNVSGDELTVTNAVLTLSRM